MRHPGRLAIVAATTLALAAAGASDAASDPSPAPDRRLQVGVKPAPPFVMRDEQGNWRGLAVELWETIARGEGIEYDYVEYELEPLLDAVEAGRLDLAVGALTMTPDREHRFDFTHSYFIGGLGIAVRAERRSGWTAALERFFSWGFLQVVALLAVVLLASGLLVWLFERRENPEMFGGKPHTGIGSGFWWAAVTMTTVGYGDKAPKTAAGRTVALVWMFTSLLIISGFTAAIASALTVGALDSPIAGAEDLSEVRVASVAGSSSGDWLARRGIAFTASTGVDQSLQLLAQGRVDAVVYDAPILEYLVHRSPNHGLAVLAPRFDPRPYAFAVPVRSPWLETLNRQILAVTATPEWRRSVMETLGGS
jgi:ABC-type amino acid transport substrate-binding protein